MNKNKFSYKFWTYAILGVVLVGIARFTLNTTTFKDKFAWLTLKTEQKLDVPLENQFPELPNGCEVTSLAMLMQYYNIKVNKLDLSQKIDHVDSFTDNGQYRGNPNLGFVGLMSQANAGWCVYHQPLERVAQQYTNRIQDFTGHDFIQVMKLVSDGHPVMIITTLKFKRVHDMQTWHTKQGKVHVTPSSHACVISGYNKKSKVVYVNDPYGHKNKEVSWQQLEASYNQQGKQALYIK
ncbi:C39 family peptidase [Lactobacillus sp. ESL0684]|uniref:C39 family peptidase n=1 Tax=Lactobacillus sp. ESL0684 TaxID=2983213 RepID=UPI0023F7E0DD|nr:C39 family peptidase [Lactobacillus sp. ESL0684]WEV43879.1 C39 family peptidase [Lactobacillus sp. ESL0684]